MGYGFQGQGRLRGVGIEHCVMEARQDPEHSMLALMHEPQE